MTDDPNAVDEFDTTDQYADQKAVVQNPDGSFDVPAGFTGKLPSAPESSYPPDAVPLEPLDEPEGTPG